MALFGDYQTGSAGKILDGLFGDAGKPYHDASKELSRYLPQAQSYNMPFLEMGKNAMAPFSSWLQGMQNPSGYINQLMGGYHESPYAHSQQEQAMRAAQNAGSASGLTGSTPLMQFAQQNAQDISSRDMNQWLQHVLGINSIYGSGLNSLISGGRESANSLQKLMGDYMGAQTALTYGQGNAQQQQRSGLLSGLAGLFGL